ncbi:D-alanyl-D-alanine carboxypeptidase family protein [Amycolatopsis suaedae]|uniref:D-alanyl-D-alanine carboxypeptidase n=1 Tax=Amycolatopsis suaedae TaxID=2510978 RepID=A0A4Q7J4K0_9PSEU|nr:D-alanyl-D-alanine carboxypeptidase family protein [Amycolatopsis suaedae]RZQ62490.1 D-alanyl-D-alanine carboxypeptidase [Amycolatopsis suaedae]
MTTEPFVVPAPALTRERVLAALTRVLAVLLVPFAVLRNPAHPLRVAANWALSLRFPAEDLRGLTGATRSALLAARSLALWRDGQLVGVTSGYRDPARQLSLYRREVGRAGSPCAARSRVLPPDESAHVRGLAVDVRPREGALWLERHGAALGLYRIYDNEWWHFEYRGAGAAPRRLPSPRFASA